MSSLIRFACATAFVLIAIVGSMASAQDAAKSGEPAAPGKETPIGPLDDGSVTIGPNYKPAPELTVRNDVPKGTVKSFTVSMKESKFYPSTGKKGPNENRNVTVYVPKQYVAGTPLPFSVIQDANYVKILPTILDNMIHDKRLPIMGAVFVANGGGSRSLEYDTMSGKYAEFIEAEILPSVEKEANVKLTKDPEGRAAMGGSSGAIAAFSMAWFHPEWYRRVLSYSGSFTNLQRNATYPHGGWEYHDHVIAQTDKKPIRVWLHVSENDLQSKDAPTTYKNWVLANKNMTQVLKDKGYHYRFTYSLNSGHVEGKVTNQTLPEALVWLWQDYAAMK